MNNITNEEFNDLNIVTLENAKDLALSISNSTSKKIINFLKKNEGATASVISKELKLPASTVHYNISALVKAKIVDDSSFTYSSKGKTIYHYKLSNNIIIIVPESKSQLIKTQLKSLIPSIITSIIVLFSGVSYFIFSSSNSASKSININSLYGSDKMIMMDSLASPSSNHLIEQTSNNLFQGQLKGFLLGLFIGLILFIIITFIYLKIKQNKDGKNHKKSEKKKRKK